MAGLSLLALYLCASFITFSSSLTADPLVCLNCWDTLCAPGGSTLDLETLCPCPCINSTYSPSVTKCSQSDISSEPPSVCCPRVDNYISTYIKPQFQPEDTNTSNSCSTSIFNPAPNSLNVDNYEQIGTDDTEFAFTGTPFTCSGCITNVTIYHRFTIGQDGNITATIWSAYRNITDNSTILISKYNSSEDYYITFNSSREQSGPGGDYYFTVGVPNKEMCFSNGDIFGATVPSIFQSILTEKASSNDVYQRSPQNCQSLRNIFYLTTTHNRVLIAVSVSNASSSISPSTTTSIATPTTMMNATSSNSFISSSFSIQSSFVATLTSTALIPSSVTPSHSSMISSTIITPIASSTSSNIAITTSLPPVNPTTDTNTLVYISAGVVVLVILVLIVVMLVLICIFIKCNQTKGHANIERKAMEMHSDSLDFHRHIAINPHEYIQGSIGNVSMRTPTVAIGRSELVESIQIHDYDRPDELNFVEFNRSRETLNAIHRAPDHDYMTMTSNNIRTNTPSSISNASDRSHYSHPRPVNRYQSPSTNQRYDSPRSLAGSSTTSEYDDPTRVLEKTPRFSQKFMRTNPRPQEGTLPPEPHYDEPTPTQVPNTHNYAVLENPNQATGQAEHRHYHELEPTQSTIPRTNHYHVLEKGSGYHVPTNVERQSMLIQGHFPNPLEEHQFFLNQPIYNEPPEETEHIYAQLNQFKCREILIENIIIEDKLGEGQFGTVYSGTWFLANGMKKPVAIKRLRASATEEEKAKFLREGARMMQFFHANVVKLHGVVTVKDPPLLIQELMRQGDLKTYLKSCRTSSDSKQTRPVPSPQQLLKFCRDIASGMRHLATKKFVHRDLAARNVLLNDNLICKIADFGMTRALDHVYDLNKIEQIPLRWTAPEAFQGRMYSEQSDVYSYGIVLYEIWSLGRKPFPNHKQNQEIIDFITEKMLMPPPPGCPRNIYNLMVKCWNPFPSGRLSFDSICNDYFSTNDDSLLTWDRDDLDECSPKADVIGAPLQEGYSLYVDLQHEYRN